MLNDDERDYDEEEWQRTFLREQNETIALETYPDGLPDTYFIQEVQMPFEDRAWIAGWLEWTSDGGLYDVHMVERFSGQHKMVQVFGQHRVVSVFKSYEEARQACWDDSNSYQEI